MLADWNQYHSETSCSKRNFLCALKSPGKQSCLMNIMSKNCCSFDFFRAVCGSQMNNQTTFSLSNPYQSSSVEICTYTTFTVTMNRWFTNLDCHFLDWQNFIFLTATSSLTYWTSFYNTLSRKHDGMQLDHQANIQWPRTKKESSAESGAELPPLWEISFLSPLNGCVDGSDILGILETLPLPFLASGPNTSIMYFQPSIGLLLLNMRSSIKLAICK